MQNAKDSFYEELRGRLSRINPERTVSVRGVTRPGLVVDENETPNVAALPDCFHMTWSSAALKREGPLPLVALTCQISYATAGSGMNGGLDRGRMLAAMDAELVSAVSAYPQRAAKTNFAGLAFGGTTVPMQTQIWWSDITFGTEEIKGDRVLRHALVQVMSLQEAGEL